MDHKDFINEVDMLKGNIARVCASDDADEISVNVDYAIKRLLDIKIYRLNQMKEGK